MRLTCRSEAELLQGGEVLGIDASQGMSEVALTKEQDNLRFRRLDINDLDFEDRFDVASSNATLHWVRDHRRLLRNVLRALRPAGRLRFNCAGGGNCPPLYTVVRSAMARDKYQAFQATLDSAPERRHWARGESGGSMEGASQGVGRT